MGCLAPPCALRCKTIPRRMKDHPLSHDRSCFCLSGAASLGPRSFAAMRHGGFRAQFITYVLAMMADNIEHVISYWVVFQKFHSPALGGFAVLSHWLPFLLSLGGFRRAVGAVRSAPGDPGRHGPVHPGVPELGLLLRHRHAADVAGHADPGDPRLRRSAVADPQPDAAPAEIVEPADLQSAVRLNAMARYLGNPGRARRRAARSSSRFGRRAASC